MLSNLEQLWKTISVEENQNWWQYHCHTEFGADIEHGGIGSVKGTVT